MKNSLKCNNSNNTHNVSEIVANNKLLYSASESGSFPLLLSSAVPFRLV